MALNAYQTLVNQTAAKRALSGEEQERLRQIADQQGAAAASSAYLANQNARQTAVPQQQTAMPDYVAASKAKSAANQAIVNGTTAGQSVQIQNAYQKALANALPSVNVSVTNRNTSSGDPVSPAVQAALGTPQPAASQPVVQSRDYLIFGNPAEGFKSGMSAEDQASWNAIGQKYAAGDTSWNRDTNQFREDGNWSGYYDDNGNYNGWLRAVDGTGGYAPAFGGKVGETGYAAGTVFYAPDGTAYTMGADGGLTKSGNVTLAKYGSYVGPQAGYQDSSFWALEDGQYKKYTNQTAPDSVLEAQGYYRDSNGLVMPINNDYYIAQGLKNGQITPEQVALAQAVKSASGTPSAAPTNNAPENTSRKPSTNPAPSTRPSTNPAPVPTQPTQPTQNTQPVQAAPPISNAPAQLGQNAYQRYLDQWDYPDAPEWNGGQDETYKELQDYDYGQAPEWNENPPETWRDMQNYDYGQAPEYQGSPYDQQRDEALAAAGERRTPSEYQQKRDDALARAENMQWNYDPNTDPVWQALQKQYRREGDRATQEALAQASMRTGGLANSYAVTAASQAGDYYAAQLSDRLPQVYQDAYQRYLQEFQRQMGISDQYQGFDDREYSRWADQQGRNFDLADRYNQYGQQDYSKYRDTLDQYNRDRSFQYGVNRDAVSDELNNYGIRYNQYQDRLGQYNQDRNFQYALNRDRVSDAERANQTAYSRYLDSLDQYNRDRAMSYQQFRDAVGDYRYDDETQYNRAWNEENRDYSRAYQAQRDAILDNRADREWAQQLREYADQQNWKATEWQQYLREYGDKMSQQELEWAYQQYRDAVGDQQYADQTAWQKAVYDQEYADQRNDTAWEQGYKQTAYNDELERSALNYLNTNGIVTGRYAEILGVPDGTTYEQYYSRYLGGGSSSPFDETEIPAGKTPKYTPPPGDNPPGDTPPGDTPPGDTPPGDTPPDDTGNGRTWWNGRPMTDTAYDLQSRIAYGWAQKTLTKENVQRMVYDAARKGYIEDYEIPLLMRIIGVNIQGPPQQNPNVEGPITQWTK